jgi:hypothetical protein
MPDHRTFFARGYQYYLVDAASTYVLTLTGPPHADFDRVNLQLQRSLHVDSAPAQTAQVINGGNLRSEPRVVSTTVIGQVCPGDQVAVLATQGTGAARWERVRVTRVAQQCDPARVPAGAEGWLSTTLLAR